MKKNVEKFLSLLGKEVSIVSLSVVGVNTHADTANVRLPLSSKKPFKSPMLSRNPQIEWRGFLNKYKIKSPKNGESTREETDTLLLCYVVFTFICHY